MESQNLKVGTPLRNRGIKVPRERRVSSKTKSKKTLERLDFVDCMGRER